MKKNFDFFIDCLKQLPEQNTAGMPLKVYGLNVQSSAYRDEDGNPTSTRKRSLKLTPELIAEAPDLLHFEKGMQKVGEQRGCAADKAVEKLKEVDGKHMVERASVEFMSFVEDAYMFLKKD